MSKEKWTGKKQDVSNVKVFGSIISILIPKEQRYKSDIYKNWKEIFIKYSPDTTKHLYAQARKMQQILLIINLYVDKSK